MTSVSAAKAPRLVSYCIAIWVQGQGICSLRVNVIDPGAGRPTRVPVTFAGSSNNTAPPHRGQPPTSHCLWNPVPLSPYPGARVQSYSTHCEETYLVAGDYVSANRAQRLREVRTQGLQRRPTLPLMIIPGRSPGEGEKGGCLRETQVHKSLAGPGPEVSCSPFSHRSSHGSTPGSTPSRIRLFASSVALYFCNSIFAT